MTINEIFKRFVRYWWQKPPRPVKGLTAFVVVHTFRKHRRKHTMSIATLKWTDPTTRTDGSALPAADIAGVGIFDTDSDGVVKVLGEVMPGVQTFTSDALSVGGHAFFVVVRDTMGHGSARSNVAFVNVLPTLADPSIVTDLSVKLSD